MALLTLLWMNSSFRTEISDQSCSTYSRYQDTTTWEFVLKLVRLGLVSPEGPTVGSFEVSLAGSRLLVNVGPIFWKPIRCYKGVLKTGLYHQCRLSTIPSAAKVYARPQTDHIMAVCNGMSRTITDSLFSLSPGNWQ